ncbi:hypothetical protein [Brevibacillus nitrificans]|uniref:hypothetical protein n=1 Tax=Brevibacillus nitrificans TaxID=651560 RepID=UPI00160598D7|nr:hypothetical protein [Brevibacillus nitrificans]
MSKAHECNHEWNNRSFTQKKPLDERQIVLIYYFHLLVYLGSLIIGAIDPFD